MTLLAVSYLECTAAGHDKTYIVSVDVESGVFRVSTRYGLRHVVARGGGTAGGGGEYSSLDQALTAYESLVRSKTHPSGRKAPYTLVNENISSEAIRALQAPAAPAPAATSASSATGFDWSRCGPLLTFDCIQ